MPDKHIYKVIFLHQGEVYEVYARSVTHGAMLGFVEIEELTFGSEDKVVVDPSKERLEREFSGVTRSYIPLHSVLRIDEVEKEGSARIVARDDSDGGTVHTFPTPIYTPTRGKD